MSAAAEAQSWILGVAGFASFAVAAGRIMAYRQRPEPTRAWLGVGLSALGLALILNVAPVGSFVDTHVARTPNVSIALSQVLTFVDAWASIEMVMASTGRTGVLARRIRVATLCALATALLGAFVIAPSWPERPVVSFFVDTSQQPAWVLYWVLYAVSTTLPLTYLAVSSVRYARQASPWLRAGLYLVSAGSALCATFGVLLLVSIATEASLTIGIMQMAVVAAGCALVALGVGLPHLPDFVNRRRLEPMWSALTALYPEVRSSRRPDLRRLVTEVQDVVVVARARDELASPLICAVACLPARSADAFDETVADMVMIARQGLSAQWDATVWASNEVPTR